MKKEYSDLDISNALKHYKKSIPAFPQTTDLEAPDYFNYFSIQTIYDKKKWTLSKNKNSNFSVLAYSLPFKKGSLERTSGTKYTGSYIIRTKTNAIIWNHLQQELHKKVEEEDREKFRIAKLLATKNIFSKMCHIFKVSAKPKEQT